MGIRMRSRAETRERDRTILIDYDGMYKQGVSHKQAVAFLARRYFLSEGSVRSAIWIGRKAQREEVQHVS